MSASPDAARRQRVRRVARFGQAWSAVPLLIGLVLAVSVSGIGLGLVFLVGGGLPFRMFLVAFIRGDTPARRGFGDSALVVAVVAATAAIVLARANVDDSIQIVVASVTGAYAAAGWLLVVAWRRLTPGSRRRPRK